MPLILLPSSCKVQCVLALFLGHQFLRYKKETTAIPEDTKGGKKNLAFCDSIDDRWNKRDPNN